MLFKVSYTYIIIIVISFLIPFIFPLLSISILKNYLNFYKVNFLDNENIFFNKWFFKFQISNIKIFYYFYFMK